MRTTTAEKTEFKEKAKTSFGTMLLVITFRVAFVLSLVVMIGIGVWAVLALTGGLVSSGDPLSMIKEWYKAVSGG